MKPTKNINVILNGKFEESFTLELGKNDKGQEYGILTCPVVKWLSLEEQYIQYNTYELTGELLACIEKHFFDNNAATLPVKGYPINVSMEDIIHKILSPKLLKQMLTGTFKLKSRIDPTHKG